MPRDGKVRRAAYGSRALDHSGYYRDDRPLLQDGWFDSGDVAVLDDDNTVRLTDRAKDVIKSGGEWISSIDVRKPGHGMPWRG